MRKHLVRLLGVALLALFAFGFASPSRADTGAVRVVFTKGGFIAEWAPATASWSSMAGATASTYRG
jgi:hypothetical protein